MGVNNGMNFAYSDDMWKHQVIGRVPYDDPHKRIGIGDGWQDTTKWAQKCVSHEVKEFTVWDDKITANCSKCNERIELKSFPGGILALRSRHLLEQFINEDELSEDSIAKLFALKELLRLEIAELEIVADRIQIVEDQFDKEIGL